MIVLTANLLNLHVLHIFIAKNDLLSQLEPAIAAYFHVFIIHYITLLLCIIYLFSITLHNIFKVTLYTDMQMFVV